MSIPSDTSFVFTIQDSEKGKDFLKKMRNLEREKKKRLNGDIREKKKGKKEERKKEKLVTYDPRVTVFSFELSFSFSLALCRVNSLV